MVRADRLILTKLDEADGLGGVLAVLGQANRPVSYLTTGQAVPDDIEPADREAAGPAGFGTGDDRLSIANPARPRADSLACKRTIVDPFPMDFPQGVDKSLATEGWRDVRSGGQSAAARASPSRCGENSLGTTRRCWLSGRARIERVARLRLRSAPELLRKAERVLAGLLTGPRGDLDAGPSPGP